MGEKINKYSLLILKVLVFVTFLYTAGIMFRLRNQLTAMLILFSVSLFIVFNKLETIDKKLKTLGGG